MPSCTFGSNDPDWFYRENEQSYFSTNIQSSTQLLHFKFDQTNIIIVKNSSCRILQHSVNLLYASIWYSFILLAFSKTYFCWVAQVLSVILYGHVYKFKISHLMALFHIILSDCKDWQERWCGILFFGVSWLPWSKYVLASCFK